ncbi:MAG: glycine cleavage system aminomethyltransferase GcvT [Acidobacteriota bacterium]
MATPSSRRTPLHDRHVAAGARMVDFAGWSMPVRYGSEIEEHHAVRRAAGLFDVSHMGEFRVQGPGALGLLQRLTPNNVAKLAPGRAHYSAFLTPDATYVDDLLIYQLAVDDYLLVVNAANIEGDWSWLDGHAAELAADVELTNASDEWALLALQGPQAESILGSLTDVDLAGLRYYHFVPEATVAGVGCLLSRTGYTGEEGFELYLPPGDAPAVWDALLAAGDGHGLLPAGLGARDTLRLEAGMALYGHEIDRTTTPYEAALGWTVKLKKGDFLGREVLVRQKAEGVERRLVGLEMLERGIARQGYGLLDGDERVGEVTSGTWSPTLEKAIATGYLPAALADAGTEVDVEARRRRVRARVVPLPFYRRSED